jgi:hypothetical protein
MSVQEALKLTVGESVYVRGSYGNLQLSTWIGGLRRKGQMWKGIVERDGKRFLVQVSNLQEVGG